MLNKELDHRQLVLWLLIGIALFCWSDFLTEFLNLENFSMTQAKVISVNDIDSVYWASLEVSGQQAEGYFHTEPTVGESYNMLTSNGKVYFDSVDKLVFVENRLNHSGGLFVLNLTTRNSILLLRSLLNGVAWGFLIMVILYRQIKRSLKQ